MSTGSVVTVADPPSSAETDRVTVLLAADRSSVTGCGHGELRGEPLVLQLNRTWTGPVYHPVALNGPVGSSVAVMTGSRRTVVPLAPAWSTLPA
jgi:hypothetical protein